MDLTSKLGCKHFQRKNWILGKVWSFHIRLPWKSRASRFSSTANKYVFFGSNSPFKLDIQLLWSSLVAYLLKGVAITAFRMGLGKTKEKFAKSQPLLVITSLRCTSLSPLFKGPSMRDLIVPIFNHLSFQKLSELLQPTVHFEPFTQMSLPLFTAFQVLLWALFFLADPGMYFFLRTSA